MLDIGHPKDINVFKNVIKELEKGGHQIKIVARSKENIKEIMRDYNFECEFGPYYKNYIGKIFGIPINDFWLYKKARSFNPDMFISFGSPYAAHVSRILGKPHLAYIDTEIATPAIKIMLPFTDKVYTSSSFYIDLGPKQERFNGYYELAYLHPKYFTPNREIPKKYGLDDYIILRLSALGAHHDINAHGFSFNSEAELEEYINALEKYGRVIISSEITNWNIIADHRINFSPDELHDILYFAKMYIGEGATMASEAAILGVPAIYISNTRRGYLDELEDKYELAYTLSRRDETLNKVIYLFKEINLREKWNSKRQKMLEEKVDTVKFMVENIEQFL